MAGNGTDSEALASANSATLTRGSAESIAHIARMLVDCGMIAREELDIVHRLMQGPPAVEDHAEKGKESGGPGMERSLPA